MIPRSETFTTFELGNTLATSGLAFRLFVIRYRLSGRQEEKKIEVSLGDPCAAELHGYRLFVVS
jgi:hypothetical protein